MVVNPIIENMIARRSIRKYKSDPIPSELLETVLESGRFAPSGSNTQKSHFIVFRAGEKLEKLKKLTAEGLAAMNADDYAGFPARNRAILRLQEGYFDFIYNAPCLIVIANEITYPNNMADSALASGNMMLAAHSLGLGSCYINLVHWAADVPAVREFLLECGMKDTESVYASVALGYSDMPLPKPPARTGNVVTFAE